VLGGSVIPPANHLFYSSFIFKCLLTTDPLLSLSIKERVQKGEGSKLKGSGKEEVIKEKVDREWVKTEGEESRGSRKEKSKKKGSRKERCQEK
jgi:hypothetical protein